MTEHTCATCRATFRSYSELLAHVGQLHAQRIAQIDRALAQLKALLG